MKIYCLLLLGWSLPVTTILAQTIPDSAPVYTMNGICVDTTGMSRVGPPGVRSYPKAAIYAVVNDRRERLGICTKEGSFDVLFPAATTQLIFEADGYKTYNVPVHAANNIPSGARFQLNPILIPADSPASYPDDDMQLAKYLDVVDSIAVNYTLTDVASSMRIAGSYNLFQLKRAWPSSVLMNHKYNKPGTYSLTLTTKDKELISTGKIELKRGLNLMRLRISKPASKLLTDIKKSDATSVKINPVAIVIYFEQSKYDIRPADKAPIDSLIRLLSAQLAGKLLITGYTDNVGNRELNTTLSEFRAKTVQRYCQQQGVPSQQIRIDWKGPDATSSPDDPEPIKAKSRRVIIQLVPD